LVHRIHQEFPPIGALQQLDALPITSVIEIAAQNNNHIGLTKPLYDEKVP